MSQSSPGPASPWSASVPIPDTVVRFKVARRGADSHPDEAKAEPTGGEAKPESTSRGEPPVGKKGAKKGKGERFLGPSTVVKPALCGAAALFVVQGAMKMFLHA